MQAVGRARMLGKGQTLLVLALSDVTVKISGGAGLLSVTVIDVLDWVTDNTIASCEEGLLRWASRGQRLCVTEGEDAPLSVIQKEELTLRELYGHVQKPEFAAEAHKRHCSLLKDSCEDFKLSKTMMQSWNKINRCVEKYGSDLRVLSTNIDGECEREVRKEIISEIQVERQLPKHTPRSEVDWLYQEIFQYNAAKIINVTKAISLREAVKAHTNPIHVLHNIDWHCIGNEIYCTQNFIKTLANSNYIEEFLRPVDVFLQFKSMTLLLSEREADGVLPYMQAKNDGLAVFPRTRFIHLAYSKVSLEGSTAMQSSPSPWSPTNLISEAINPAVIATIQLFNGETTYCKQTKAALVELLNTVESRTAALLIPSFRGQELMISRSDLEDVCTSHRVMEY